MRIELPRSAPRTVTTCLAPPKVATNVRPQNAPGANPPDDPSRPDFGSLAAGEAEYGMMSPDPILSTSRANIHHEL